MLVEGYTCGLLIQQIPLDTGLLEQLLGRQALRVQSFGRPLRPDRIDCLHGGDSFLVASPLSPVAFDISHASGAMAAIIKILTALINDIGRATRDISVWLPTFHHNMTSGRLRTASSKDSQQ